MFRSPIIQNELFQGIMGINEFKVYQQELTISDRQNIALISITEPDNDEYVSRDKTAVIGFADIIEMKFWDIEEDSDRYKTLTVEQGTQMKDFIIANKGKKFLVHCKAGQSRSAGVGKAIECLINFDGDVYGYRTSTSEIDSYKRYSPNQTVFDYIVK
jgi:predicted protein tyrosine phosphatase